MSAMDYDKPLSEVIADQKKAAAAAAKKKSGKGAKVSAKKSGKGAKTSQKGKQTPVKFTAKAAKTSTKKPEIKKKNSQKKSIGGKAALKQLQNNTVKNQRAAKRDSQQTRAKISRSNQVNASRGIQAKALPRDKNIARDVSTTKGTRGKPKIKGSAKGAQQQKKVSIKKQSIKKKQPPAKKVSAKTRADPSKVRVNIMNESAQKMKKDAVTLAMKILQQVKIKADAGKKQPPPKRAVSNRAAAQMASRSSSGGGRAATTGRGGRGRGGAGGATGRGGRGAKTQYTVGRRR